jgi:organic radical activating enzyme
MATTLISSFPIEKKSKIIEEPHLLVAEFFGDTLQGEGISCGVPSTFLRLQTCTLNCVWCDTAEVWRQGNPYRFEELLDLIEKTSLHKRFQEGQHLILTGGSPLKQQKSLALFLHSFIKRFSFKPYIEIENEMVLMPIPEIVKLVDQWNNSPKLANSKMPLKARYKQDIIKFTAQLINSWCKFVITSEDDWQEIKKDFLDTQLISKEQIILMPEGCTREELHNNYEKAFSIAVRETVRFTDRMHVTIWNKKTGV